MVWRSEALFERQADAIGWMTFHQPWHSEPDYEALHPILAAKKIEEEETFEEREAAFRAALPKSLTAAEEAESWREFQETFNGRE